MTAVAGRGTGPPRTRPAPARRRGIRAAAQGSLLAVRVLIVTVTVFQRFVLPVHAFEVLIALPVALLVLGVMVISGQAAADARKTVLYVAAVGACVVANTVSTSVGASLTASFSSTELLAVLYIPLCFQLQGPLRTRFTEVLEFFQRLMLAAAVICVGQFLAQWRGYWEFTDLERKVVPSSWLVAPEAYNYSYPQNYGSGIFKSNGIVFLEPSFCSQFLALAIVVQIVLGARYWRLALLGAALVTTMSGTGILLLAVGLAVLAIRRGGKWATRAFVAVGVTVAVIVPFTPQLTDRAGELGTSGSSGNTRFVASYTNVLDAVSRDGGALAYGRGGGTIDRDADFFNPNGLLADYPALPKLVGEYGLPAALLFVAFVLTVFLMRTPSPTLGACAVMLYFVLSGSLLQPPIVVLCWTITGLFAAGPPAVSRLPVRRTPLADPSPTPTEEAG
jgi:hypothetical protein